MPGIYIDEKKICSLGFRVQKGCTLHGLAINVNMNLQPFNYINPCGYKNIKITQIKDFHINITLKAMRRMLLKKLSKFFNVFLLKKNNDN